MSNFTPRSTGRCQDNIHHLAERRCQKNVLEHLTNCFCYYLSVFSFHSFLEAVIWSTVWQDNWSNNCHLANKSTSSSPTLQRSKNLTIWWTSPFISPVLPMFENARTLYKNITTLICRMIFTDVWIGRVIENNELSDLPEEDNKIRNDVRESLSWKEND